MRKAYILIVLLGLVSQISLAENTKDFYLLDSINEQTLSERDRGIVDSILTKYHQTDSDSIRFELLDFIASYCSDDVALAYTNYTQDRVKEVLKDSAQFSENKHQFFQGMYANTIVNQGYFVKQKGHTDSALVLYKKGYDEFEKAGDELGMTNARNNIASAYFLQNRFEEAIDIYLENIPFYEKTNNVKGLAVTYINLSRFAHLQGKIEDALFYAKKSLTLCDQAGLEQKKTFILNTVGNIYVAQGEKENALKSFEESLALARKLDDKRAVSRAYDELWSFYREFEDAENGLDYLLKSIEIKKELNRQVSLAYSYNNLAAHYRSIGDLDKAFEFHNKSLSLRRELEDPLGISYSLTNLGRLFLENNNLSKAKKYGQESLEIAQQHGYAENIKNAAELLSDVYKQEGNWKSAFDMNQLFIEMKDSLNNNSTQKAAIRTQLAYEYEKKKIADSVKFELDKEIADLRISEQEAALKEERTQRYALTIGLLLAMVLAGVSYYSYRTKQRDSLRIEQKSKENELLLGEIHHRVKNNLQVVSSLLNLQMKSLEDESAKGAIKEGKERIKSIGLIHTMLYQHDNFSSLEMLDYTKNLCNSLIDSFSQEDKKPKLNADFSPVKLDVDTAIPIGLIISELVMNSLKYAYEQTARPELSISMKEANGQFHLEISDNGKGKVEEVESGKQKSFGMRLVDSLTKQLNGTLTIKENNGLTFTMSFDRYQIIS